MESGNWRPCSYMLQSMPDADLSNSVGVRMLGGFHDHRVRGCASERSHTANPTHIRTIAARTPHVFMILWLPKGPPHTSDHTTTFAIIVRWQNSPNWMCAQNRPFRKRIVCVHRLSLDRMIITHNWLNWEDRIGIGLDKWVVWIM